MVAKKNSKTPKKSVASASKKSMRPAVVAQASSLMRPSFRSVVPLQKGGEMRVAGVDYVGTLASATSATAATAYDIYAGNATLFPRLSQIADTFLKSHFNSLRLHVKGRSASTVAGNLGISAVITDGLGGTLVANTESIIKNTQNCLVLRGWEDGVLEIPVKESSLLWLSNDTDAGTAFTGSRLGIVQRSTSATASAGDLTWDIYVEYDVEFAGSVSGAAVN